MSEFSNSSLPSFQPTQSPYLSAPNANLFSASEQQAKVNKEAQSQSGSGGIRGDSTANFKEVAMRIAAECAQLPDGSPGKANCLERLARAQKLAADQETLMAGAAPKEAPKTPTPAATPSAASRRPTGDPELDEMDSLTLQINANRDPAIQYVLKDRLTFIITQRTKRAQDKIREDAATKRTEQRARNDAGVEERNKKRPAHGRSPDAFVNNSQDEQKWQDRNKASQATWDRFKTGKISHAEFQEENAVTTQKFSPPKPQPQEVGQPDPLNGPASDTAHMPPAEQQILARLRDQLSRTESLPEPGRTNLRRTIEGQIRDILNHGGAVNTANNASTQHNATAARIANERENWKNMPQAQRWAQVASQRPPNTPP